MPNGWNLAEIWEHVADVLPDAPAQVHGPRRYTWAEMDRRADGIAATLLAAGARHQDKVALYLYTVPEYLESVFAAFKAGLAPVNTNYRYGEDELVYLWDNADAVAVVFHGTFADRIAALRHRVPRVRTWLWVDDGAGECPYWAVPYEQAAASATGRTVAPWGRSGDDLFLIYTGGTTGFPKGVMWRQDDLVGSLDANAREPLPPEPGWDALDRRLAGRHGVGLPAAPLMHGTGAFNSMWVMMGGGCIVTMEGRHFDPVELLDTIEREKVTVMSMVGDAFGKPLLRALDAEPDRWDISSLRIVMSSGVMFSTETKAGLLRHNGRLMLLDTLGSTEALSMAVSTTTKDQLGATAQFKLGARTKVIADDGTEVMPGSGVRGRLALAGRMPLGYYKDPEKSASTFAVIGGQRYSIPGDYAEVEADGTVKLLGRGSNCINTGGEKVYPEEVEEVLKLHPSVRDAVVVGVPDERFGESVTALVEPHDGHDVDEAALIAHVKGKLASYKAPRRIFPIATVGRAANGKLDLRGLKDEAVRRAIPT